MRSAGTRWWMVPAVVLVFSALWEFAVRADLISSLFFPAPTSILNTIIKLTADGTLLTNISITLVRMSVGLVCGGLIGMVLGLALGWSWRLRVVVDPFIAATHNIPKIAVYPLIMLIFGIGEFSKIFLLSVAAFFPMVINTMSGVRQISRIHFEVAKNYGAGTGKLFARVILPGSLPMMLAGLRIAFNVCLMVTIATELLAAKEGLGVMIWFAWETLRTEQLYAALAVTSSLGIGFNYILSKMSQRLVHWQTSHEI